MGWRGRGGRKQGELPGRNTQTALVLYFALGRNDSWAGNQNYSPDPLCCKKNMWDFRARQDAFSLSFYMPLPSPRQTGDSHRAGASRDCHVPTLLKAALCALYLSGTRHRDFSARKIAARFLCHFSAAVTGTPALSCAT